MREAHAVVCGGFVERWQATTGQGRVPIRIDQFDSDGSRGVAERHTLWGSRTRHTSLTSSDRLPKTSGMIAAGSLRLLYLIFLQVLKLVLLLGRTVPPDMIVLVRRPADPPSSRGGRQ